ncbi:DUF6817 domain-containing protein [Jidongwangia harbinensis]|uniref:DUF6817 domain-containing protein n=1 Tax=Jidongwangia harbinensis TaxID=2878561 RepID=UPI001CDA292E|nr:hypothetical protein [Jidongwangia harbinensis]MCA2214781.1 hypothetical protein [Jidongwangia harbinensis]
MTTTTVRAAREWLRERGAERIGHAGGSLLDHLGRVHDRMAALGLDPDVRLAGLTHAAYGTDGFGVTLLDPADRAVLRALIGTDAEEHVYRYGGCDRGRTWRALGGTGLVRSRFTGHIESPAAPALRAFADLCIVNELDVMTHDPVLRAKHAGHLRGLFAGWAALASPSVTAEARRVLG